MPKTPQCSFSSSLILITPAAFGVARVVSIMPHLAIQRKRRWWLLAAAIVALLAVPPPKRPATTPVIVRQLRVPVGAEALTVGAAELPLPIPADVHLAGYGPFRKAKGVRDAPMA